MVDPNAGKDAQRDQLSADVEAFLSKSGEIKNIPMGQQTKEEPISKRWIAETWPKWRDYGGTK